MTLTVRCRECGLSLARHLERLLDLSSLDERDRQPHIPRGSLAVSDGSFFTGSEGALMVHLEDAVNTEHYPAAWRLNGCCGLDGCDGLNTVCANGHEVGTEKSDCWMPHVLLLDPSKTVVEDEDDLQASA